MKRPLLKMMLLLCALTVPLLCPVLSCAEQSRRTPPNIVVMLADDLGWGAVGYHDNQFETPNIDRLVSEGMELNRFYVAPMCSPTRAGFMTGRYPIRFGCARAVIPPQRDFGLPTDETTIAEALGPLGYRHRGVFGKWHLGHRRAKWHPLHQGFTHFHGHYNGAIDYFQLTREGERDWHTNYTPSDEQGYSTDLIANAAAAWIRESARDEAPFFCYVPFNAPHSPFQAPQAAIDRFARLQPPAEPGTNKQPKRRRRAPVRQILAAMIWQMDQGIGQILQAVHDSGEADDTIVWFFSDNGGVGNIPGNNRPLRGSKLSVFEGGIRVPACVRWPTRIKAGSASDHTMGYIDMLPTLVAAAGGDPGQISGQPLDGLNLLPLLENDGAVPHSHVSRPWFSYHGQAGEQTEHLAVASGGWKLKVNGPRLQSVEQLIDGTNQVQLFHLEEDLVEQIDLRAQHPDKVRALGQLLVDYRALQPDKSVPPYAVGKTGFVPPARWELSPEEPDRPVGRHIDDPGEVKTPATRREQLQQSDGLIGASEPSAKRVEKPAPTDSNKRPNIVIVLVDDMGFSDIGCYGGEIDTPNLDRLAAQGLRFTQFCNSGRCCPTRASLMTGLHPHQVGIGHMTAPPNKPLGFQGPYQGYLNDNCITIAQLLKSAGYHTLMTGKWHLGANRRECWPLQRGFDHFYGALSGAFNYFKPGGDRGLMRGNQPVEPGDDFYATDTLTDVACEYVEQATQADDRPFFLYLAYNAPHWPLNSKWEEFRKYQGKYSDGWEELMRTRFARQKELGLFDDSVEAAPHVGPPWESLSDTQREDLDSIMAAYAGCIDSIDQNIGKLVRHLKQLGQLDNTLIFFLSDNGACQEGGRFGNGSADMVRNPPLETVAGVRLGLCWANACNMPFRLYKHYVHEGGACTPMIAHWPAGIPRHDEGSFVRQVAYLPDFMATCLELSRATYPASVPSCEGKSLVPLLKGSRRPIHVDPIYWEHEGNAAVRWGKWKLVREYEKPWELYDIDTDRTELHDLAATNTAKRDQLVTLWEAWATRNQVAFPKRFNMYEYLSKKEREAAKKKPAGN